MPKTRLRGKRVAQFDKVGQQTKRKQKPTEETNQPPTKEARMDQQHNVLPATERAPDPIPVQGII